MENRKKTNNIKNPKEAIYLLLFEKPLNSSQISKELYKKFNTKVSTYLTELESDEWVKHIRSKDYVRFKKGEKKDSRKSYYEATSEGLFIEIHNRIICLSKKHKDGLPALSKKLLLTDKEKDRLKDFLLSESIKEYVTDFINNVDKREGGYFDKIITDISLHCLYKETINAYIKNTTDNTAYYEKEFKKLDDPEKSKFLKCLEWDKLGLTLQSKLANLLENPSANQISYYFDNLILMTEAFNNKKIVREVNGNDHGLS